MNRSDEQLCDDALAIWQAGVDAVRSDRLIEQLREAARNAKVYLIDMAALARFAEREVELRRSRVE